MAADHNHERTELRSLDDAARREFLKRAGLGASGFVLWAGSAAAAAQTPAAPPGAPASTAVPAAVPAAVPTAAPTARGFAAYLAIGANGDVQIVCPQVEIGQGVYDTLPRILAEELDADWARVSVVQPWASAAFVSPVSKRQRVGNSDSVVAYYATLRKAGAAARQMLVGAAAARWGVAAESCRTTNGRVLHEASGRSAGYGELAAEAVQRPVPEAPRLKNPSEWTLLGKRLTRKDTPSKTDGSAIFGSDVKQPGLLHAAIRRSTSVGGRVARFDAASVASRPGVTAVVPLEDGVAVVADSWWRASQAAAALDIEFDDAALRGLSSAGIAASLQRALASGTGAKQLPLVDHSLSPPKRVPSQPAAVEAALATPGARAIDVSYEAPYLAHMTMEPQVCTVLLTDERCEIWAPHQQPDNAQRLAAQLTGLPPERIRLNITFGGGGFGRRWELDSLRQTLQIARAVKGRPVKLLWSREDDVRHGFYRPAYVARYRGAVARDGRVLAVHGRIAGQSLFGFKKLPSPIPGIPDPTAIGGLIVDEYELGQRLAEFVEVGLPVPVGFWRSVALSHNGFFGESLIDELAVAAGRDPYQYRRTLLARHPRALAVLERAAVEAGWGKPLPAGHGRGIAISLGFGAICAQVAQVAVRGNRLTVERITCAYDCGPVLDPGTVAAQLEGGIVFGLGAALSAQITLERGSVQQGNFHEHPVLRIHETPRIDVHLVPSDGPIGGAGESSVPSVAPAIANAIHAATGRRLRRLPLRLSGLEVSVS